MEVKKLQKQRERGTTAPVLEPDLPQIKVPDCAIKPVAPCCPELNVELQDSLDKLMIAQTYLFEFLDDYYDADLILKRQMEVYVSSHNLSVCPSVYPFDPVYLSFYIIYLTYLTSPSIIRLTFRQTS